MSGRRFAFALALAALTVPVCAAAERPEGIVERWLISLNQGAAGDPGSYAPARLSERVLPGWSNLEPGELDVIEVGLGRATGRASVPWFAEVPFRVVTIDGKETIGVAFVARPGARPAIKGIETGRNPGVPLPSDGGPPLDRGEGRAWVAAFGVAALLILLTIAVMRLAPDPSAPASRARPTG
ncbi:MAG: hypothetical protein ACRDHU_05975 [Actinomycetota bacterium]